MNPEKFVESTELIVKNAPYVNYMYTFHKCMANLSAAGVVYYLSNLLTHRPEYISSFCNVFQP